MSEMQERLLVPLDEAAGMLGCSRHTVYRMHHMEQIRIVKLLGKTMVPVSELERIARGEPMQNAVGEPVGEPLKRRIKKVKLSPQLS